MGNCPVDHLVVAGLGNWCVAMLETNGLMKNLFANEIIQVSN